MRDPGTTSITVWPADLSPFPPLKPSTLFADSTRRPFVEPLSVTHQTPLSSQISQWRRLAYLPLTTMSHPSPLPTV
jgi:hypothetical protein